jgi:rhodanese-related sulfurtransferase
VSAPTRRYHVPSALRRSSLRVGPEEARELVAAGALLVDVRRHEDKEMRLEGAIRIAPDEIPGWLSHFSDGTPVVLACT